MSRGDLIHLRGALFRDEHEPSANVLLGGRGIIKDLHAVRTYLEEKGVKIWEAVMIPDRERF
jgi:hypothetical protein